MREILFRGKRKDNGEWVEGLYFKTPLTNEATYSKPEDGWNFLSGKEIHCIVTSDGCVYEILPETLGQFTGLLDKNGTKIYEGDIVKKPYGLGWEGIVIFEKGQFIVDIGSRWIPMWEYIEVIGNIHEENNNGTTAND